MRVPRWQAAGYAVLILLGVIVALPNFLPPAALQALPDFLPKRQVALGLDLKGGSYLLLEVDSDALIKERIESQADSVSQALRAADIGRFTVRVDGGAIVADIADRARVDAALRAVRALSVPLGGMFAEAGHRSLDVAEQDGRLIVKPTDAYIAEQKDRAIEQNLEIMRRRLDAVGVAEPTIVRQGAERILIQLPGVQDPGRIKALLGTTAKMTFHFLDMSVSPAAGGRPPAGVEFLPGERPGERYAVKRRVILGGERLTDAGVSFDHQNGQPVVTFRFDSEGARRFADITRANVGQPFAIVLDGKVLTAPVIREPITGGSGQISGNFTVQSANDLAVMLRAGALPAPLKVIEERTVGADLGADAIHMGALTGLIGLGLVVAFMVVLYGAWGLVADLALLLNVTLTFAALSLLGATLTLPGIAGIVLGVGLAVDANVLINERIREETRRGRRALAALDVGFKRAYSTIVDSNLTTLIATALLFLFGAGPVRGFAVTMGLGILISMFTAVSVVRMIMIARITKRRPKQFVIRPLFGQRLISDQTSFHFMRARFIGIGVSAVLSVTSIVLFVTPGLNYGIDFVGGIVMEVDTRQPADLAKLRAGLERLDLGEIGLQQFGKDSDVLVRIERQPDDAAQIAAIAKVKGAIEQVAPGADFKRVEAVGPKVSGELNMTGIMAVGLAALAMLIYIWIRFEWPFAIGAIATLALDVTKTVGLFALIGLDFNLTAVAALLTLIGYSVNDKVVVFDRVRENLRLYKKMKLRELIDLSINSTLARSVYTSATAFLAMLPMALAGGSAVSSFAIPMIFGIVVGASSSIFIAAPILLFAGVGKLRGEKSADAGRAVSPAASSPGP